MNGYSNNGGHGYGMNGYGNNGGHSYNGYGLNGYGNNFGYGNNGYGMNGYGMNYNNFPLATMPLTTTISSTTSTATVSSACSVEVGINYPGFDLSQVTSSSASDCCNICGSNQVCTNFAYQTTTNTCYLKTGENTGNRQTDSTITFGIVTIKGNFEV